MTAVVGLALFGVFALWVAAPFRSALRGPSPSSPRREKMETLEARGRELVITLRDLELDFKMGKLNENDFRELEARHRSEATEVLHKLERLSSERSAEAERLIAFCRNQEPALTLCGGCKKSLQAHYRFCPYCGRENFAGPTEARAAHER